MEWSNREEEERKEIVEGREKSREEEGTKEMK